MNCPSCDGKNREDARFCKFCGADLLARCRMCGAILDDDARFCDACGTPVGDPGVPAHAGAARKVVTVLFADLSGSTALEERMDAESVRSILDRFYAAMRSEIERHGGKVVKFTGDGVMAAFGVPDVHEDDAARAVDASLAMREELEQLASDLQLDVVLNIGVNTGEVVVSETDDDVVGDAVNIAARLEGAATGGEILVGEETWRLTRATSRYEAVEPLTLKGKAEPVPAYRLLSVDERTADSAAAPFVGREAELGRLLDVFQDCVDANAARLVTIIGSPGLGKTRLARELMSELSDAARVRETRCDPAGSSTFAPVADALRAGSGISETDTEEEIVAALAARLPEDDPDRDRVAQRAASIFGAGVPGTTEETFWAIRKLMEAAARIQPVVFVLDDIHWAEPLLLDLIEHLAEWIRDAPVLLVGTARPELRDLRPSLVEGGRAAAVIALEGLDRAATAQLALNLLEADTLPDELLAKIPASTEGNPLFVRELVRMLVDDDVLRRTSDGWEVTVDVDAIQVPPTISSLLSARVDRLRNDERTVVELASVVGKEFYRGAIVDLAPDNVKDLVDGCLESLRRKELVEPIGTYWIDEPVYTFHHALIQDAAYRRVLKERRADLHERVAGWLEVKTADVLGEHDELLGYHLEQAHEYKRQLGRPDNDLGSRAAELLGRAAQRALESDDLPAAATLSGRALDRLTREDERLPGLLLIRCEALLSMGDVGQGVAAVSEFDAIANTPRLRAWTTCFHGQLATLTSSERLQETESLVAAAAAELTDLGDQAGAAKAHTVHASTLAGLGRFAECETVLDQALTAARAAGDRRRITATLGSAPHAALWGPNPVSRAGGRCLDIVRLLRITTGSPAVEATSLRCQAVLEAFRGRTDAARRMLGSARRTLSELGLEHELLEAEQFSGIVELVDGDAAAAEQHLRDAFEGFTKVGVDVLAAQSAARLARALLNLGEDEEAESFLAFAEQHGGQDLKTALSWRSAKAELLARRGEFAEARALAEDAVAIAERTDALIDHGIACRSLGVVLRAAGDADGAREAEARARALFERKGATALMDTAVGQSQDPRSDGSTEQGQSTATRPSNTSTRQLQRYVELFARRAWDEIDALTAPDCWFDDRRAGVGWSAVGADAVTGSLRAMADAGTGRIDVDPIATRGERASLIRWTVRGRSAESFVTEMLIVVEIDASDRVCALIVFDLDELVAAIAELDRRFAGALDPVDSLSNTCAILFGRLIEALQLRDWSAVRSFYSSDVVMEDRRAGLTSSTVGADTLVEHSKVISELGGIPSAADVVALRGDRLGLFRVTFDVEDFTVEVLQVAESATDGTMLMFSTYDGADLADAIAELDRRFAEGEEFRTSPNDGAISTTPRPPSDLENACVRIALPYQAAFERGDFDTIRSMCAKDVVYDDRRAGLANVLRGRDAFVANIEAIATLGAVDTTLDVLAIRGERFSLAQVTWSFQDPNNEFAVTTLNVVEIDEDGLVTAVVSFEEHDIESALAELDDRYLARVAAPDAGTWRVVGSLASLYNHRDWSGYRAALSDDFVLVDHRPAYLGTLGPDEWIASGKVQAELAPDVTYIISRVFAIADGAAMYQAFASGLNASGAYVEISFLQVALVREGRIVRLDFFPLDAEADALARYEELVRSREMGSRRDDSSVAVHGQLRNAAIDADVIGNECFVQADWDGLDDLLDDAFVAEDRRAGLRGRSRKSGHIEQLRVARDLGVRRIDITPLATRGDRLALCRLHVTRPRGDASFESVFLAMTEVNSDGRSVRFVACDEGDIDAAFDELDARYADGEGAGFADVVRRNRENVAAINARDWVRYGATATDDFTFVDHRPASLGTLDMPGLLEANRSLFELIPDIRIELTRYRALDVDRWVAEIRGIGHTADGDPLELAFFNVGALRDAKVHRSEFFAIDRLQDALARFDQLAGGHEPFDTTAVRVGREQFELIRTRDWDALRALTAPNGTAVDRRSGLGNVMDSEEMIANAQAIASIDTTRLEFTPIATRGDRLVLGKNLFANDDPDAPLEVELLVIYETTPAGQVVFHAYRDVDDLDGAFAELDDRYVAQGGEGAGVWRVTAGLFGAHAERDWDAVRALIVDDVDFVDHRPASLGRLNEPDRLIEAWKVMSDLAPDIRFRAIAVERIESDLVLADVHIVGTSTDGAAFVSVVHAIGMCEDGRFTVIEFFEPEDEAAAVARFEELRVHGPAPALASAALDSYAVRSARRFVEAFAARDWDFITWYFADDCEFADRRPGLQTTFRGKDAGVQQIRTVVEAGVRGLRYEPIAIRGDRLVLARYHWDASDWDVEVLSVDEVDAEGRSILGCLFAPEDLDAAFDELDRRYALGEGAPFADVVATLRIYPLWNVRDHDGMAVFFVPSADLVDRRTMPGADFRGRDAIVSASKLLLTPDIRHDVVSVPAVGAHGMVVHVVARGTNPEGGFVEIHYLHVVDVRAGLVHQMDRFDVDDLDAALRRFDELGPRPDAAPLENAATGFVARLVEVGMNKDEQTFVALHAPSFALDDRRSGLRHVTHGLEQIRDYWRAAQKRGLSEFRNVETIAIRGDRLALSRRQYVTAANFESEQLVIDEVDEQGLVVGAVFFDLGDMDAAFDELDGRYLAGEGARNAAAVRLVFDQFASYNTRDWEAFAERLTDDYVFVDHRPASAGTVTGADEHVRYLQTLVDLAPDVGGRIIEILCATPDRVLARLPVSGRTQDGAVIELAMYVLHVLRDGRICRLETYPFEAREAALARFDELIQSPSDDHPCLRWQARREAAIAADDWASVAEMYAEDAVFEDHRSGLGTRIDGRDAVIEQARFVATGSSMTSIVLATRGARLALIHGHITTARGYEVEMLLLHELDASGRQIYNGLFDPDDLDTAFAELETRYVRGEGAPYAAVIVFGTAFCRTINERRWDDFRDVIDDDMVFVDHRPASLGTRTKSEWVDALVGLVDLIPTLTIRYRAFHAIEPDRWLAHTIMTGASADGADVEIGLLTIAVVREGKLVVAEVFPDDALDAARAAYEALARSPDDDHPCSRLIDRNWALAGARDWSALAEVYAVDCVFEDHRSGLGARTIGRDAAVEQMQVIASFDTTLQQTVLAKRGEGLALLRCELATGDDFVVETLLVVELDAEGRFTFNSVFDAGDLDAAYEALDDRYFAGEGAPYAAEWRLAFLAPRSFNRRDFDAYRDAYTEDFVLDDHRPAGWGREEGGPDARVAKAREMVNLSPDAKVYITETLAGASDALMGRFKMHGTSTDGSPFEIEYLSALGIRDGRVYTMDYYDPDDEASALARFEELAGEPNARVPLGPQLENAATRHWEEFRDAWNSGAWDGSGAEVHPDVVIDDRRSGLSSLIEGRDGYLAQMRIIEDMGAALRSDAVAVRGERLSLVLLEWYDPTGRRDATVPALHLNEVDFNDLLVRSIIFDPDDLDAAFTELDRHFLAGDEATVVARQQLVGLAAHNRRDWHAFSETMTDDAVIVDHRPAGFVPESREAFVDILKLGVELLPDRRITVLASMSDERPSLMRISGADEFGNTLEWLLYGVYVAAGDRIGRIELYDPEQLHLAKVRLRELASHVDDLRAEADDRTLQNDCSIATPRLIELILARDWERMRPMVSDAFRGDDRRAGLRNTYDVTGQVEMYRVMHDLGMTRFDGSVIATRGARLALMRLDFAAIPEGGAEVLAEVLVINELDGDGLFVGSVLFDLDDEDAAFDELDERYVAGDAALFAENMRQINEVLRARNGQDWEALRRYFHHDVTFVDHRVASAGELTGIDRLIEFATMIRDVIPDIQERCVAVDRLSENGAVFRSHAQGTNVEGGTVEFDLVYVALRRDGLTVRAELYDAERLEDAIARYDELVPDGI